jgi:hypothetical protein
MESVAAAGSRTNPAQLVATERRARTQEQNAVSAASPGSNPPDTTGKSQITETPAAPSPPPSSQETQTKAVEAKAQTEADNKQASREAGVPEVYGQVDPTKTGHVFSLSA